MKRPLLKTLLLCLVAGSSAAYAKVNGVCGSANGTAPDSVLAASNDTLCASGTVAGFSGSGPWTWACRGSGGGTSASCSAQANTANTCLPITMPSRDTLLNEPRKVFAHYFGDFFNLSRDNIVAPADFYNTNWLLPVGAWQPTGGFLRSRPVPVPPGPASLYRVMNFARDIRMALARGITGFAYEIGQTSCPFQGGAGCLESLKEMLAAAQSVDPRFKIMVVPDASIGADVIGSIVQAVYDNPAIYKYNGKMVVAPWWDIGMSVPVATWTNLKSRLAKNNTPIFFMPIDTSSQNFSAQQGAIDGWGYFATAAPRAGLANVNFGEVLANMNIPYMAGVTPQHYRPSSYTYYETVEPVSSTDSVGLGFIDGWHSIVSPSQPMPTPPWVLVMTWNDFSEATAVAPYTDINQTGSDGTGFYNLTGYFASWYLTHTQPTITHDVLYYFHKKVPVAAAAPAAGSVTRVALPTFAPGVDLIEVVGFLTKPGTIRVSIGGKVYSSSLLQAGMQVFQVPLAPGIPTFSLSRNGQTIINFQGQTMIHGNSGLPSGYTDMTYWSGSGSANGVCKVSVPPESLTSTVVNSNNACGPASGTTAASAPTKGLCARGTASAVIGTGPFTWSCSDPSTSTVAICSAHLSP